MTVVLAFKKWLAACLGLFLPVYAYAACTVMDMIMPSTMTAINTNTCFNRDAIRALVISL
jgi:hypothetical protein